METVGTSPEPASALSVLRRRAAPGEPGEILKDSSQQRPATIAVGGAEAGVEPVTGRAAGRVTDTALARLGSHRHDDLAADRDQPSNAAPLSLLSRSNALDDTALAHRHEVGNGPGQGPDGVISNRVDVIRRYSRHRDQKWSENSRYVTTSTGDSSTLGIADGAEKPALSGATWVRGGEAKRGRQTVPMYRLTWDQAPDGSMAPEGPTGPVEVPQDCITTAELVAAWLTQNHPEVIGEIDTEPTIKPFDGRGARLEPGSVLFHVHDPEAPGEYHAAAVIATDGGDAVTLEADSSDGAITPMPPIFDMYEGRDGFEAEQTETGQRRNRREARESTYVISFLKEGHRSEDTTLWDSLTAAFADESLWGQDGRTTAERIINSIEDPALVAEPRKRDAKRKRSSSGGKTESKSAKTRTSSNEEGGTH